MKKIGFCGTNSSGKTTLTYQVLYKLKSLGVICDGVLKQDRRLGFDQHVPTGEFILDQSKIAHHSLVANQIKAEADMSLRNGLEMLISDRTPLDYYAYYVATFGRDHALELYIRSWMQETFAQVYVLGPVAFEKDPGRPSMALRDSMWKCLQVIVDDWQLDNICIEPMQGDRKVWRHSIPIDLIAMAGKSSKLGLDIHTMISTWLSIPALIGGSYAKGTATIASDLDLFVRVSVSPDNLKQLESVVSKKVDLNIVPNQEVWNYLRDTVGFIEVLP